MVEGANTIRNSKIFPPFDTTGFRKCQIDAIHNLEQSFAAQDLKPDSNGYWGWQDFSDYISLSFMSTQKSTAFCFL